MHTLQHSLRGTPAQQICASRAHRLYQLIVQLGACEPSNRVEACCGQRQAHNIGKPTGNVSREVLCVQRRRPCTETLPISLPQRAPGGPNALTDPLSTCRQASDPS